MQINGTNGAMLISTTLSFIGVGASEVDYGIYLLPPDHIIDLPLTCEFVKLSGFGGSLELPGNK